MSYSPMSDKDRTAERVSMTNTAKAEIRRLYPQQMAFWPEERRAIANELARCSLINCRDGRKAREYYDNVELFMLGEGTVTYKGEELRTQDEDIFVTLAHLARDLPSGKMVVTVKSSDICKMNGWPLDQRYYSNIYLSIQRMKAGVITVFSRRLAKALKCQKAIDAGASEEALIRLHAELQALEERGMLEGDHSSGDGELAGIMLSLISGEPIFTGVKQVKDNIPQGNLSWQIPLDRNLVALFAKPYLTLVDMQARSHLSGAGKRLQAFFSSHKRPYAVKLRSLEKLLGMSYKDLNALKHNIKEDLETLKHHGVIEAFSFEKSADNQDWLVQVTRPTTQND